MTYPGTSSNFPLLILSYRRACLKGWFIRVLQDSSISLSAQSHTYLSPQFVNYQQQSVTAYSATYKLLFKVMFCDCEQNSSWLINSAKSIQLPGENATERLASMKRWSQDKSFKWTMKMGGGIQPGKWSSAVLITNHYKCREITVNTTAKKTKWHSQKHSNCCLLQRWCHQSMRVRFNKTKASPVAISSVYTAQVKLIYHTGRHQVARRQSGILCHWRSARHLPDSACLRAMSGVDNVCGNGHQ